ncbi:helix-turn-helix domain-containing protein [Halobacillus campisalis]|uniref:Tetratricopeptide repeat protein n=1 Tax=Halobacillus campisalis TaxID=435909 RepID=A0ABW2K490_9BACI|nr:tetratricopeptide repeat protein [Halobacillus campisalis]
MNIGKRINIYRKIYNMTLNDLAGDSISTAHLSKIENGYRNPGSPTLRKIAQVLDLPFTFFEHYAEEDPEVHHILVQLEQLIITDIKKAQPLIETLDENYYGYLSNVNQELYYLLLKCAYYCKCKNHNEAQSVYEAYIHPFIDEDQMNEAPLYVKNAYHYCLGIRYYQMAEYSKSLEHYKLFSFDNQSLSVKAALTYNIAVLSNAVGDYRTAVTYSHEALSYYESLHQPNELSMVYNLVGVIYLNQEKFEEAMDYLTEAEKRAEDWDDRRLLTQIFHNKGVVMRKAGCNETACDFLERALQLKEEQSLTASKQITYHSLCKAYVSLGRLREAEALYNQAKQKVCHPSDHYYLLEAFLDYYLQTGNEEMYQQSLETCIGFFEQDADKEPLDHLYLKLANHLYETGKYKRAAESYLSHIKITENASGSA